MSKKRKTREQKIRAKLRRLEKKLQEKAKKETPKIKVKGQKDKGAWKKIEAGIEETAHPDTSKHLSMDLRKTFLLTLLAVGFEFVVYWWVKVR